MVKYIGSKRTLVPKITEIVTSLPDVTSVFDVFSGTSRVGHALKRAGYYVHSNDHNLYAYTLAHCYVQADRNLILKDVQQLIKELQSLKPIHGYFTETFCIKSRYFHPKNGEKIDAIREAIAQKGLNPDVASVILVSLMEAADRVDSTTGLQMAYLKTYAARAYNDLELRIPDMLPGSGSATHLDAADASSLVKADLAYLDPPYNQHSYLGNYHIWESLVRWDKPEVYGVACKRIDCKEYSSPFNSKRKIYGAFKQVVDNLKSKYLLVSFNNEGYLSKEEIESILSRRGYVHTLEVDFKRYVGAQIGIFNPKGEKVGKVSHLNNKELLYLVLPEKTSYNFLHSIGTATQLSLMEG